MTQRKTLSHLDWLEAEAIHIMREVAGQCANPVLLFSGGKDSICMLRIAEKAFRPGKFPFPLLHIDTGHNYPEVIAFRDRRAAELGERLIVRSVEDSIARGTVRLARPDESRNRHQSVTLREAIEEFGFDCLIGGAGAVPQCSGRPGSRPERWRRASEVGRQSELLEQRRVHERDDVRNAVRLDVQHVELECLVPTGLRIAHVHARRGLAVGRSDDEPHVARVLGGTFELGQLDDVARA